MQRTLQSNEIAERDDVTYNYLCKASGDARYKCTVVLQSGIMVKMDVKEAIERAAKSLGYDGVKEEQEKAISHFLKGTDVFVALPTGYGKSLCYAALLCAFDCMRSVERSSIVVVVSPLLALMKDQVAVYSSRGLAAAYVSSEPENRLMRQGVLEGLYQLVYISPELLFRSAQWREMLREEPYMSRLVAFVVDEAHCVKKW